MTFFESLSANDFLTICFFLITFLLVFLVLLNEKRIIDLSNRMAVLLAIIKSNSDTIEFLSKTLQGYDVIDLPDWVSIDCHYPGLFHYDDDCYLYCENYLECIENGIYTERCENYTPI